jgi:hypothetical protein
MMPLQEDFPKKSGSFLQLIKNHPLSLAALILNVSLVLFLFNNRLLVVSPVIFTLLIPPVLSIIAITVEKTKLPGIITLTINSLLPLVIVIIVLWLSIALSKY